MKLGSDTTLYRNHQLARPRSDEPKPVLGMPVTVLRRDDRLLGSVTEVFHHQERIFVRALCRQPSGADDGFVFFKTQLGPWQHVRFNKKKAIWEAASATSLYLGLAPMHEEQFV